MPVIRNSLLSALTLVVGLALGSAAHAAKPPKKAPTTPDSTATAAPAAAASSNTDSSSSSSYSEPSPTGWIISDKRAQHHENQLSVMLELDPIFGTFNVGLGAYYSIPVIAHGPIPAINNSLAIEFGAFFEYYHWSYDFPVPNGSGSINWYAFAPLAGVRWDFYLTRDWTVFAGLKLGYAIGFAQGSVGVAGNYSTPGVSSFIFDFSSGAIWHFSKPVALRMELSSNFAFLVGVVMSL
jgi:hypothetical protein